MKKILITITVIALIGFASSILLVRINTNADLAESFIWGLNDAKSVLITVAILWAGYFAYENYKGETNGTKQ